MITNFTVRAPKRYEWKSNKRLSHDMLGKLQNFHYVLIWISEKKYTHREHPPPTDELRTFRKDRDKYLQSPKNLVYEELHMVISEFLAFHNVVQICSHQVCHQVPRNKRNRLWSNPFSWIRIRTAYEVPAAGLTVPKRAAEWNMAHDTKYSHELYVSVGWSLQHWSIKHKWTSPFGPVV